MMFYITYLAYYIQCKYWNKINNYTGTLLESGLICIERSLTLSKMIKREKFRRFYSTSAQIDLFFIWLWRISPLDTLLQILLFQSLYSVSRSNLYLPPALRAIDKKSPYRKTNSIVFHSQKRFLHYNYNGWTIFLDPRCCVAGVAELLWRRRLQACYQGFICSGRRPFR